MSDLWAEPRARAAAAVQPLALRMRPRTLEEFEGQEHILGEGKLLRRMLRADVITSIILHGPPGTGKTTLAELIAAHSRRHFERENAASVGVKRIREIIEEAQQRLTAKGQRTILFLDEIHRFTRAQQDVLLGDVERGLITLIGATTENPLFACNSALVSRSTLLRLEPLDEGAIGRVLRRAIADPQRGFGRLALEVSDEALRTWAVKCDGDARRALTALEVAVLSQGRADAGARRPPAADREGGEAAGPGAAPPDLPGPAPGSPPPPLRIDRAAAEDSIQQKAAVYDITGDEHYDAASALIKSLRGSDPDAAVYWVARMLEGGEDPRFIARRMAILASEDVGNADPQALALAAACWELVERIGLPEARITLAQCATYLAMAPKSNAAYVAIEEAAADVREGRTIPVPFYLKDGNVQKAARLSVGGARGFGAAEGYQYSHDAPGAVTPQDYLGVDKTYYRPTDRGREKAIAERLAQLRALRDRAAEPPR